MRHFLLVAVLAALSLFGHPAAADAGKAGASALQKKSPSGPLQTLTIGVGRDFFNGPEGQVYVHGSTNTWEGLTCLDETFAPRPWLAESWHSPDGGITWIFVLRAGVRFHDGSPLSAEKAALALNRLRAHPRYDPNQMFHLLETLTFRGIANWYTGCVRRFLFFPNLSAITAVRWLHPKR